MLQEPIERELKLDIQSTSDPNTQSSSEPDTTETPDYCYDVPLLASLQWLLNCEVVAEQVCKYTLSYILSHIHT